MGKCQQGGHDIVDDISIINAYIGITLTWLYRGDMWFHHIQQMNNFHGGYVHNINLSNHMSNGLDSDFFLLSEVAKYHPYKVIVHY